MLKNKYKNYQNFSYSLSQEFHDSEKSICILVKDNKEAIYLQNELSLLVNKDKIKLFPENEILPYDHFSVPSNINQERFRIINSNSNDKHILITSIKNLFDEIENESFVQKLPLIIKSTEIIWQSLLPEETGEATVTVRLEDEDGNLLSGRVLTVQNRADLFTRLRVSIGAIFLVGAGIAIISPILPLFTSLLGL